MPDDVYVSFTGAAKLIGIPEKWLTNYFKIGKEVDTQRIGRRILIDKNTLLMWKEQRDLRCVKLTREHYIRCLEFAIKSFYHYSSSSDFGTAQQRDAGKFITNFVIGKLGEIAVSVFLKREFDVDVKLDFEIRESVVGQDITEIAKPRRGGRVYNPPAKRIAVKTSKMKNIWLLVSEQEVKDPARKSDVYIFSRVDLFLNHFIRFIKGHEALASVNEMIPSFIEMNAEVCGFVTHEQLMEKPPVKMLPQPKQEIQSSYIIKTGELKKSKNEWQNMIDEL